MLSNTNAFLPTLIVLCVLSGASDLRAQSADSRNFDANRLRVTTNREDILNVYTGRVPSHLDWDLALLANYANDAVTLNTQADNGDLSRFASLLTHRVDAHLVGALGLFDFLQLAIDVPVTVFQERSDDALSTTSLAQSIESAGIGDVRVAAKLRLLRQERHILDVALAAAVSIPSAQPRDSYLGERTLAATPELVVSRAFGGLTLATNVGARFRDIVRDREGRLAIEHEVIARAGLRYDFEAQADLPLSIDATWEGFTQLKELFERRNTGGSELLFGLGYNVATDSGVQIKPYAGAGFGLQPGYSIPDYRVFAGVSVGRRDRDRDGDGLLDSEDRCPDQPEDIDTFEDRDGCPDLDNDRDGVPDMRDGAPMDPEDADDFEDGDGVPDPDNDGDGVLDADDACRDEVGLESMQGCPDRDGDGVGDAADRCPDEAEDRDEYRDDDGCPDPDNDSDGVLDASDRCPLVPGLPQNAGCEDADRDGDGVVDRLDNCPDVPGSPDNAGCKRKQLVTVKGCRIDATKKVYFQTGKAAIRPVSFSLLDNLVALLKVQDNIERLRIEGHTDSQGSSRYNRNLSQKRADSVRRYLEAKNIAPGRLVSEGFGEDRPIDSNETRQGRENNRRVEFIIDGCEEVQEVEVQP